MNLYFVYGSGPVGAHRHPGADRHAAARRHPRLAAARWPRDLGYAAEEGKISTDDWRGRLRLRRAHRGLRLRHGGGDHARSARSRAPPTSWTVGDGQPGPVTHAAARRAARPADRARAPDTARLDAPLVRRAEVASVLSSAVTAPVSRRRRRRRRLRRPAWSARTERPSRCASHAPTDAAQRHLQGDEPRRAGRSASSTPDSAGPTALAAVCAPVTAPSARPAAPVGASCAASGREHRREHRLADAKARQSGDDERAGADAWRSHRHGAAAASSRPRCRRSVPAASAGVHAAVARMTGAVSTDTSTRSPRPRCRAAPGATCSVVSAYAGRPASNCA